MINSLRIAAELQSLLPDDETPESTEGYEGFYHLNNINGDVDKTVMKYIIRDHDRALFEKRKAFMTEAVEAVNAEYPDAVTLTLTDQYYNMKEIIDPLMHIVDIARDAMIGEGVAPIIRPIRGGTDGSRLSFMGLPCPNIFAGGLNFHGRYECVPLESMERAVEVLVAIIERVRAHG